MNTIFYITIFLIGILFGSFYTLAVYRLPKGQDITHTHSYCPNCNNKLGFFELIPILSYICLGGKCKNCKQKIRIRYLLLELAGGILFVLFALALKLDINNLNIANLVFFVFIVLYLTTTILIAGIDKESRKVEKSVLYFGIITSIAYIVYLYIIEHVSIYRYVIYLVLLVALLIADNITLKKKAENSYAINILLLIVIMAIFTGEFVTINSIIVLFVAIAIYLLINKLKTRKNIKQDLILNNKISLAFFLCCINIIIFLLTIGICGNYTL